MKEWQLFKTLIFDEGNDSFEYDNLDFTDFYFICTGIKNSTDVASGFNIFINDIVILSFSSQNKNGTDIKNEQGFIKWNGLFWEVYKIPPSNNLNDYYTIFTAVNMPYSQRLNVGKARKIKIKSYVPQYQVVSGTVQIYAR